MIKRSEAKVLSRLRHRRDESKSRKRRLFVENLETRRLLAADALPLGPFDVDFDSYSGPRDLGTVQAFNYTEQERLGTRGDNDSYLTAEHLPLGNGSGDQDTIDVRGTLSFGTVASGGIGFAADRDFYSFDLDAGDVLDIATTGAATGFTVYDDIGRVWFGTDTNEATYPPDSPLQSLGNAALAQVVPEDGRYFVEVAATTNSVNYTLGLRTYRPVTESLPINTGQALYLDFDGGVFPRDLFNAVLIDDGLPLGGVIRVPTLQDTLADLDIQVGNQTYLQLTRSIIDQVETHFAEVGMLGSNGDFESTGNPGDYGITILNSFDHPDPGSHPLVTRMLISGTEADYGFSTVGIAQSVDVGNFDLSEIGIVQMDAVIDIVSDYELSPSASLFDAVARLTAVTTSHEAGHTFGLRHTDGQNFQPSIADEGGFENSFDGFLGVGPDEIFGTVDDQPVSFTTDRFSRVEGIFGTNFVPEALSHALATGTAGGQVSGRVFRDLNANGSGTGDPGLAGVTVFADANGNGQRDPFEPSTVSSANGNFTLDGPPGSYNVIAETPDNASPTTPISRAVNVSVDATVGGVNFGFAQVAAGVTGFKWLDVDGDGLRDPDEPGIEGVYIYLDLDEDGNPDIGEPSAKTEADGSYSLEFPGSGTFTIREVVQPGFVPTFPGPDGHTVVYTGQPLGQNYNFGNESRRDFSDAPTSYGSPSHGIVSGLSLGQFVDPDQGPLPTPGADGDDLSGPQDDNGDVIDDEDGVLVTSPLAPGQSGTIEVTVTNDTGASAYLQAWIDFGQDGQFDAEDRIATDLRLGTGAHVIDVNVPADAELGETYARFRLSQNQGVGPDGPAQSGEVEDHLITLLAEPELANDDTFSVTRNSTANELFVLQNDFVTATNGLEIQSVGTSDAGVRPIINTAGGRQSLFYSPPTGFLGRDEFTYTVRDNFGNTATATVTVNVTFQSEVPIAVDDTFSIPQGSSNRALNVLDNDIGSTSGGVTIVGVTPGSSGGSVSIIGGGQSVRYTPQPGFAGTEQFTYTIQDPAGNVDSAQVTVNLMPDAMLDDLVEFSFQITDTVNNTPVSDIQVGESFDLTVLVDDLRGNNGIDPRGVASGFLDVLYNTNLVAVSDDSDIRFGDLFAPPSGGGGFQRFDFDTPGVINEAGAVQRNLGNLQPHPGPVELFTVTMSAVAPGVASFQADPADDAVSETILIDGNVALLPRQLRLGDASLNIRDASNNFPSAIDDSFPLTVDDDGNQVVAVDSAGNPIVSNDQSPDFFNRLDVLANDNFGPTGTINEFGIEVNPSNGTVEINDNGTPGDLTDDFIEYVADPGFNGFESFTYSIVSGDGIRSTAEVTLNVGTVPDSQLLVGMDFQFVDEDGNPVDEVNVGDVVGLRIDVDDIRNVLDQTGVFAAFLDVLYSADILSPVADSSNLGFRVEFGTDMDRGSASGFIDRPGLIDEFGTNDARGSAPPTQDLEDPRELATLFFTATSTGTAEVVGSPADFFPFRDTLLFGRDAEVPIDQVVYDKATLSVVAGGGGEGEAPLHNLNLPQDVNDDGFVSAIDALLVINGLNRGVSGEGESAATRPSFFYDVNGDNRITALDALMVINSLSRQGSGGEGEGSVAAPPVSDSLESSADDQRDDPAGSDAVFAELDESPVTPPADDPTNDGGSTATPVAVSDSSGDDEDDDEMLSLLADDVGQVWG